MTLTALSKNIERIEEVILSVILVALITLACLQIALRLFFGTGLIWADPLLRYLTLWGGMLGAVLAVSQEKHISLDILNNLLNRQIRRYLKVINYIFCTIVCGFLSYASLRFIFDEISFGGSAILAIPSWALNLIFPIGFGIMTLRFFLGAVHRSVKLAKSPSSTKPDTP